MKAKRITRRRNPLRRTSDRIEAWLTFSLIMTMLLVTPWLAWSGGRAAYRDDVRTTAWERQHRFAVTAVLLKDAAGSADAAGDGVPPAVPTATGRWIGPDGAAHIGSVTTEKGARRGSTIRIWVDENGAVTVPPGRRSAVLDAAVVALMIALAVGGAVAAVHRIVVWRLNRRRLLAWQAEWLVVGPLWTHR